ncbi:MAG: YbhB/YbcL family Raf kinase inhibitor-like protein [Thermoplasmataceae archaeon]
MTFKIAMPSCPYGEVLSQKYTCDGQDISPEITWSEPPSSTKSFILIMEDPDAPRGTFVHWVIYNIKPDVTALHENIEKGETTPEGYSQGVNDFGKIGYGGPCPPGSQIHRYFFYLYAVLEPPNLKAGLSRKEIDGILRNKTIKVVSHMVKFGRNYKVNRKD